MQKGLRINDSQLNFLATKARVENANCGALHRRNIDSAKWQLKWFALQHNLLFCYDTEGSQKLNSFILLEGCYAEEIILPAIKEHKQYGYAIFLQKDHTKLCELKADGEFELRQWIESINSARFSKLQEDREQLEQKHLHVLHILEAETQAKWQNIRQIEDLNDEVKKLKAELRKHKAEVYNKQKDEETAEIRKVKKVQSFFRGWLCRRRWKQIVELYIKSPHAESMRTRNSVVFGMVEDEEDYVKNLSILVTCFLRPLRMAASSKKPIITHGDVNSIFLNSETVLFLHQIFLKGLTARMDNWPTLVIGDLFDMLLPMLGIYQEYVRNHHYSLQVLAEYKQKPEFNHLLKRFEEKPSCENRVLETFLTYPMHQIPKYILALHELLAHTPYEHVERKKLEYAKSKLEELSMVMHDEVSETENIRRNLSIERMIIEGCDILLDTSQVFVRQGMLLQVGNEKKYGGLRLGNFSSTFKEKEVPRKVFLFTHHLLIATRLSNGRLHLAKNYGKIPLAQCMLIEDTSAADVQLYEDEANSASNENGNNNKLSHTNSQPCNNAFRIIVQAKEKEMPSLSLTFVASTLQEKSAWCSDISQCMENLHYTDILSDSSSSNRLPQSVRVDPKAFTDDKSVKYCRTVNNSCKIPQIRHATVMKLLERLTDPRFLSIDFLNTFLLTYKVFTNSTTILDSLQRTVKTACNSRENDECSGGSSGEDVDQESDCSSPTTTSHQTQQDLILEEIAYESDTISQSQLKNKQPVYDPAAADKLDSNANTIMGLLHNSSPESLISGDRLRAKSEETESQYVDEKEDKSSLLEVCVTLKPCDDLPFIDEQKVTWREKENGKVSVSRTSSLISDQESQTSVCSSQDNAEQSDLSEDTDVFDNDKKCTSSMMPQLNQLHKKHPMLTRQQIHNTGSSSQTISPNLLRNPSPAGLSKSFACKSQIAGRSNSPTLSHINSSRSLISGCKHNLDNSPTASSVITSSRVSRRRCSSSAATTAFAVATAGASTAKYNRHSTIGSVGLTANYSNSKVNGTFTAVMRALNVIKHWISKYPQDFKQDTSLCCDVRNLLEDLICHPCLVPTEQKLAFNILKSLNKELEDQVVRSGDLYGLLTSPSAGVLDDIGTFETIAAIDIAEQITYLDHQIFMSISGEELLGLAWMKPDKHVKASHVIQASQRFNEVSQLVVTEIISKQNIQDRVTCIEKWAAIADILACTHNFNGVLQICAAFVNSSIYRLSKTWERLTKQTKQIISKLQNLVSSEGRFKNMREALHKCDNACIPYLGMYLSDLSFIEEGSPNFVEEGLVNYSKMRMITNVIREIQEYQQQTYTIQYNSLVCAYLLNRDRLLSDEETYKQSLTIEPRIVKTGNTPTHQPDKPVQQQA